MIGQSQVTDPLMTALRTNRVNHAYLFSGPRGCGKTTSARILARCLNCAEGPTDTPCGVCPSCVELSRDGSGSLDVVEIDAASHNGVDDARDIRERAIFAPARDRYKIFILDEAHMVTPQGFNALLKIVEEPPEHIKFIFATTEPEKVIGTIRSRTHHYPFRLVPPAQMLEYSQTLCDSEGITVAPGVLPLVVRAGGGSPRDTLSLLDQLMAGSESNAIEYERAVALLGYTHGALLDEAIDAVAARDSAAAFGAVDRVIQTGQDPRRFVEDLLERMRDLIIVAATSATGAAAVLRGVPQDELDHMAVQAAKFGPAELSRIADILNAALTEMNGATSPRLHLELMIARALIPASDDTNRGALARVERLERRIGVAGNADSGSAGNAAATDAVLPQSAPVAARTTPGSGAPPAPASPVASPPLAATPAPAAAAGTPAPATTSAAGPAATASPPASASPASEASPIEPAARPVGPVTLQQIKDAWPQVLEAVKTAKMNAWLVVFTASVLELRGDDVLVISFPNEADYTRFKQPQPTEKGVSEFLREAIIDVLGLRVKFIARVDAGPTDPGPQQPAVRIGSATPAAPTGTPRMGASPADGVPESPSGGAALGSGTPAGRGSAGTGTSAGSGAFSAGAPVASTGTGWATVAIPGSATATMEAPEPPFDEEPPFDDIPPPFDDDVPPDIDGGAGFAGRPAESTGRSIDSAGWATSAPPEPEPWTPSEASDETTTAAGGATADSVAQSAPAQPQPAPAQPQPAPAQPASAPGVAEVPAAKPARQSSARPPAFEEKQRYGESVVREILGATFLEEQPHISAPRSRGE
jgi:DNA polymerase III subunit gamma/tau